MTGRLLDHVHHGVPQLERHAVRSGNIVEGGSVGYLT
jgi:hypothetical protein